MIERAAEIISNARHVTAFTGAGISVESGIPPFRGPNGLWNKYDPKFLDIYYFNRDPEKSWKLIKEIFYDFFGKAKPNAAHFALAELEKLGLLKAIITQNIDNLHQEAGSQTVYEFHGNSRQLTCTNCGAIYPASEKLLETLPPRCEKCGGILKPDFIFFGEPIPEPARSKSFEEAELADVFLVIGTTGEIMPASLIPREAKSNGATIIEINTEPSNYTYEITDVFLKGKATEKTSELVEAIKSIGR
jgi:NAD-dependent deacetylase